MTPQTLPQDSRDLADKITSAKYDGEPVSASLSTDEKVIARITDGIYRQPASALRELISNAYDADSTSVSILTDYPRFEQVTVRDNGIGMNERTLANMIRHIGGSAKRDALGSELGFTDRHDPSKTPSGRKIIGKIGIGLFSVAQLTQQFQIITKVKGSDFRLIADVTLKTYTEDEISEKQDLKKFESGTVEIRKVTAVDIDAQGTDVILLNLRKNALSILRSEDIWIRLDSEQDEQKRKEYSPSFHIGRFTRIDSSKEFEKVHDMNLPWEDETPPKDRFKQIYKSMLEEVNRSRSTPSLENTFDQYFRTIWSLANSSPIEYIDTHPFQLKDSDEPEFFMVSNRKTEQVKDIKLEGKSIKELKGFEHPKNDPLGGFSVYFDGIKLFRPISFNEQPKSQNALRTPLLFYGKYKTEYDHSRKEMAGGNLSFEAYFYWNSKIIPIDHNGISIRINNASGTLFDSKWLEYPVAEKTTLGQICAEVFVIEGLDSALNIDRESFNYAHPHYQILSKWVHNALRQITAKQKKLRADKNKQKKIDIQNKSVSDLYKSETVEAITSSLDSLPVLADSQEELEIMRKDGHTAYLKSGVFTKKLQPIAEEKVKLIMALLESFDLLSNITYDKQQELASQIAELLTFGE